LKAVVINSGFEEKTSQPESTNKEVKELKIRLANLVKIFRCLVHNSERVNLAMGGLPTLETDY
jgi:hypothetical protein